jgi:phage I-like protein
MQALAAAASAQFSTGGHAVSQNQKLALTAALCAALSIPEDANEEQALQAIDGLKQAKTSADERIAALTAQVDKKDPPDPSKFVPIESFNDLQARVAALTKQQSDSAVDALVKEAEGDTDGKVRITAANKAWFTSFAEKDIEAARAWLKDAPVIAALSRMQSRGHVDVPRGEDIGDPAAVAVLARKYQDEQTAAAVAHVTQQKGA